MVESYKRLLILGCGTCVSVCMAGGEKEVEVLASELRMLNKKEEREQEIEEATIQRQCDREYIDPCLDKIRKADAVLSMACAGRGAICGRGGRVRTRSYCLPSTPSFMGLIWERVSGRTVCGCGSASCT